MSFSLFVDVDEVLLMLYMYLFKKTAGWLMCVNMYLCVRWLDIDNACIGLFGIDNYNVSIEL